jgi:hypothetical protein
MAFASPSHSVWFPQWAAVLAKAGLPDSERHAFRRAIGGYLAFCKQSRQRATIASARAFMEQVDNGRRLSVSQSATWKTALNWFFKAAHSSPVQPGGAAPSQRAAPCSRDKEPPLAAWDLGGPEWEQKLIREIRSRHYQWRTEQAYRMWAKRFVDWLERRGGSLLTATETELRDFLSELAVRQRAAAATQRQAFHPLR